MTDIDLQAIVETITLHPLLCAAPASAVLQLVGLVWLRGPLRSISLILAVVTGAICALATAAYVFDSGNSWQLVLLLAGPPLFVGSAGVLVPGLLGRSRPSGTAAATSQPGYQRIPGIG